MKTASARHTPATDQLPTSKRVLLLIDFINPLQFSGANAITPQALEAAQNTADLKRSLRKAGVPAIYANDNYGRWQSDFKSLVRQCVQLGGVPAQMARLLCPAADDLTILKPRHSAFYGSPLALLLQKIQAEEIIITGLSTDICVQFTAMDAFLRGFQVRVPADCTAAESPTCKQQSLKYMRRVLNCDTAPSAFLHPQHT
ncbi:MAG: isochorismatase family cysteine hydrolase [Pseudomonadota bacterium]